MTHKRVARRERSYGPLRAALKTLLRRITSVRVAATVATLLTAAGVVSGVGSGQESRPVRVWAGTIDLPTYAEGPPNPNPPFDLLTFGRFNYPYPIRDALTDRAEKVSWRTLHLENEYLKLTVLPDLGGHVYSCVDKRTGRDMFYANTAIKKALIGYRGAWAAFGVEFNFPVSHNWVSMSPVDFATRGHADGSASIWVGNTDQVYGGRWVVELRLSPGRSVLEQHVELYNASDVRHRYYWWSNGAVQVWNDSRLFYPTELMATHGFTSIEPWPVGRSGKDLSVIRNQTDGPVSLFTYGTREPFVGVYHPRTSSGTVHVANPAELPVHKFWSWGNDRDAASWRTALSDDDSAYVELQAGLFRNQETYAFLEPQESVRFTEWWLPVRDLGGITRATSDAVLHMERPAPARLSLRLDVTRDIPGARIRVHGGETDLLSVRVSLSPREVWRGEVDRAPATPVTVDIEDAAGTVVFRHIENALDLTPASEVRLGAQSQERPTRSLADSADDFLEIGTLDELEGRRLAALATYADGLKLFPGSTLLLKAAGRLAVTLGRVEARRWGEMIGQRPAGASTRATAADGPENPADWLHAAHARHTTDAEVQYYLGIALAAEERREAWPHLESAQRFRATRAASSLQLARMSARAGDLKSALGHARLGISDAPRASALGAVEIAMLRELGRAEEARERLRYWRGVDPTLSLFRYESTLLGREEDAELWQHLGADANRVLDLVDQYLAIAPSGGQPPSAAALRLLEREYPEVSSPQREPGSVSPGESPLVAYYRASLLPARDQGDAYAVASSKPTHYVFPYRRSTYRILASALERNGGDTTARFLSGSLLFASGLVHPAIDAWEHVRSTGRAIPTLHRNLGLAWLHGANDLAAARSVLQEGTTADPENLEVYLALDGVLSAAGASPRERAAALQRFPAADRLPSAMAFKLAIALAEAGQAAAAERLFHGRFFPREEGGTNVRAVYAQVRIISARIAAREGRCGEALNTLDTLPQERPELPFTAGGLRDTLTAATFEGQVAAVESRCGRLTAARQRWQRLSHGVETGGPTAVALAHEALVRLGRTVTASHRRRFEAALAATTQTLASANTTNPGIAEFTRARLLSALGRHEQARAAIDRVFLYPDRNLSHALARLAKGTSG